MVTVNRLTRIDVTKPRPTRIRNAGRYGCPMFNQAYKVIARFGSEAKLARAIGVSRVTVYRWTYRRPYGTDGLIPTARIEEIKTVARMEGILLRPEDWTPEPNNWTPEELALSQASIAAHPALADMLR